MSIQSNTMAITLCAILAPAGFVFGSRFVGSGPSDVIADSFEQETVKTDLPKFDPMPVVTPRDTSIPIQSPFYLEAIPASSEPRDVRVQGDTQRPSIPDALPTVRVTSILPSSRNPLAIIDGKPRRVGDTLKSGWTVVSINGDDFTVTLRHSSGETMNAKMSSNP